MTSRASRLRLYAPFLLLLLAAGGCASAWTTERAGLVRTLDAAPAMAAAHGATLTLGDRDVSGFPFRLRVRFADARLERSGWTAEAPGLVAQAYIFAPRHWVVVAPEGLTVTPPGGPPLAVRGRALRASVAGAGTPAWRLVLQGDQVTLAAPPGLRPFPLSSARRVELDARRSAHAGETDVLLQMEGAVAAPESAVWRAASGAPVDLALTGRLQPNGFLLERLAGRAGPVDVSTPGSGSLLTLDAQGRPNGVLPLRLVQAAKAPLARPGTPAAVAIARTAGRTVELVFTGGKASLRAPAATATP